MKANELKKKFIDFFVARGHREIPNVSLVPENDPTVLFTTAGMHPLVPYLLGEPHANGARLTNVQRCLRTDDIEEVGDNTHLTFFEMLGNWSLGDYWKEEAISWSFEFLTKGLGITAEKLAVSVFAGDGDAPEDRESIEVWKRLGIPEVRITRLTKKDNWWGPAGQTGPCGPDTEMFYWNGKDSVPKNFDAENKNWVEIWNDVFMQYFKRGDGKYEPLKQKNVDTGMGLERMLAVLNGKGSIFETDVFLPIMRILGGHKEKSQRIIADHIRAAVFLTVEGVRPGNKDREYILRRLIRRAVRHIKLINLQTDMTSDLVSATVNIFRDYYPQLVQKEREIIETINEEAAKFAIALERGTRETQGLETLDGKIAFHLYESYGFPLELTEEIAEQRGQKIDKGVFEEEFKKHQELSRSKSLGKFAGGLADHSEETTRGHTATHLLHKALRDLLGESVHQTGSNITPERIRFDFSFSRKLTDGEVKTVEETVNKRIKEGLPVHFKIMRVEDAKRIGAIGLFDEKYADQVKIYFIGPTTGSGQAAYSAEFCGGPHVNNTSEVGKFIIEKETARGSGNRRIYARLERHT